MHSRFFLVSPYKALHSLLSIQHQTILGIVGLIALASLALSPIACSEETSADKDVSSSAIEKTDEKTEKTLDAALILLQSRQNEAPTVSLTLKDVLLMASENNPSVKLEAATSQLARDKYLTSLAKMLPDIQASYNDSGFSGGFPVFGRVTNLNYALKQPQLTLSIPIFQGGRKWLQSRAVKKLAKAQEATERAKKQLTLHDAANLYFELTRSLNGIQVAEQQLNEAQAIYDLNQQRLEAGVGTQLDSLQSKAQLELAKQKVIDALKLSQSVAARLNEALDLPAIAITRPKTLDATRLTLIPQDTLLAPNATEAFLKLAHSNRQELQAAEYRTRSIKSERSIAGTVLLPTIDLQLSTGRTGNTLDRLVDFDQSALGVAVTLPNLGASAITLWLEKSAELKQLAAQKSQLENRIEREVTEAYLDTLTQQAKLDAIDAEMAAANKALEFAVERLKVGVGKNIDVVTAQTTATAARTHYNDALAQYHQAQVNLITAVGLASVPTLTDGLSLPNVLKTSEDPQ
jgi:outer membrane protein TolC